jgi:hypothetical protein
MLLITFAALVALVSNWRLALAWGALATAGFLAIEVFALRGALYIAPAAVVFALWTAVAFSCVGAWRARRQVHAPASNFPHTP